MLVVKSPLFYLLMAPKHKNHDAGTLDMPKGSHEVLPISSKVRIGKKWSINLGFSTSYGFKYPLGVLEHTPVDTRDYCNTLSVLEK